MIGSKKQTPPKTVVDTTEEAEFDFAIHQIGAGLKAKIAKSRKEIPRSEDDHLRGGVRVREIDGWDVMFVAGREDRNWVITIAGISQAREFESTLAFVWRCLLDALPPGVKTLLKGKQKK